MANFQYRARSAEAWNKRETQSGSSYIGFIKDEYQTFSPKKDNWIRILPPTWENPQHYGLDIWVHYGVGPQQAAVLCLLKMFNEPCAACADYQAALASGRPDASDKKPTRRVLVWLVDRKIQPNDPKIKDEPVVWAMPWTVDRDITKVCRDRQSGEMYFIDHPESGYDVTFDREGESQNVKYVGTQVMRRPSAVDQKYLDFITKNPLMDVLIKRSNEEISDLLSGPAAPEAPTNGQPAAAQPQAAAQPPAQSAPQSGQSPYCEKTVKVAGAIVSCGLPPGHPGDCDYVRQVGTVDPPAAAEPAFCAKSISSRGVKIGCTLAEGHPGDCDFDRDLGPAAPPPATVPQQAAPAVRVGGGTVATPLAAPAQPVAAATTAAPMSPRAASLKARFAK